MKKIFTIVVAIIFAINANAQSDKQLIGADLIVFNAKITTGSLTKPEASALAVKRGRIYAVGTDSEILELKDNNTKLIDAHSRRLIPGINDAHTHLLNERSYNYNVRWEGVPTLKRALEMLSEQAKRTPEGQWVKVIGGWSPLFEKDKNGKYTGVMHSYTFTFAALELMVPQPSEEEQVSSIINAINDMNRFGVTTAVDAASIYGHPHGHLPIQQLAKENRLNVRMPFIDLQFGDTSSPSLVDAQINAVTKKSPISPGENLHPHMAHGHVYEGTGEILRLEIHDHENFDRPAVIIDKELMHRYIKEDITKLIEKGIPFRLHISYNENITSFLDALEEINNKTPLDGLRWSIEHAETITPENIARVKKLGGGIALDMKMAMHGDGFIKTHGLEKALQTPRLRQLVDSGIPLAITTDAFRASSYNPWIGISWMITGKSVSGSEILAKNNRLTREEALKLVTVGPTWFENQESEMGKIIPGNLADFALLNKDFFTIPEDEIKTISSVLTVLDGRIVFGEEEYSKLSPKLPETLPTWSPVKYFGGYYNTKN